MKINEIKKETTRIEPEIISNRQHKRETSNDS